MEIWLRGFAKNYLRNISTKNTEAYHPHITLVRPFNIITTKDAVKNEIVKSCYGKDPLPFTLSGLATFEEGITYMPVINCEKLVEFNNELENTLTKHVKFAKKLNNKKILHATIKGNSKEAITMEIEQYMLRLTCIENKKIWFSFDFVTQKVLNRKAALDKTKWYQTVNKFTKKYGLLPTKEGFKNVK